tara:strand:- start:2249 stop:2431 length:183 start_codon:yes stop_codon:yes gene_type:complete
MEAEIDQVEAIVGAPMKQPKKMSLETPIGKLESDSGNHYIDVLSIAIIVVIIQVIIKKIK